MPLKTSGEQHSHRQIPSIELSPALWQGRLSPHRSPQKRLSADVSLSSPPLRHRTPSVELSGSFEPLTYARRCNFAKKRTRLSIDLSRSSPTPSFEPSLPEGTSSGPRIWPFDFYADEMDIGFRKCRLESNKHRPVQKVFQDYFHVKFMRSMFYDHRRHWLSTSSSMRQQYIRYGYTERGCWSTFLRQEIKGERRFGDL